MMDRFLKGFAALFTALVILVCFAWFLPAQVTQISGLAVAQTTSKWNRLKDMAQGDTQTSGVALFTPCLWNGSSCDRQRGTIAGGAEVALKGGTAADNSTNSTNKMPVLPCVATTSGLATWTTTNQVPCTTDLSGRQTVNQGSTSGSGNTIWPMLATQGFGLFNTQTTGAANTAVVATIAAAANVRAQVHSLEAQCAAGTSTITIADGGTTIFTSMGANVPAAPATYRREWPTALTGTTNTALTVTLAACGAGNTGTLHVQGSRW